MKKVQKSASFILPKLGQNYEELLANGFLNSYLALPGWDVLGSHLILEFKSPNLGESLLQKLQNHKWFDQVLKVTKSTLVVFKLSEKFREQVVVPFLKGKYSEIDRTYVHKYFSPQSWDGSKWIPSANWQILHKDPKLKKYWEQLLEVTLPDNAEVWSIPEIDDETYTYEEVAATI